MDMDLIFKFCLIHVLFLDLVIRISFTQYIIIFVPESIMIIIAFICSSCLIQLVAFAIIFPSVPTRSNVYYLVGGV